MLYSLVSPGQFDYGLEMEDGLNVLKIKGSTTIVASLFNTVLFFFLKARSSIKSNMIWYDNGELMYCTFIMGSLEVFNDWL